MKTFKTYLKEAGVQPPKQPNAPKKVGQPDKPPTQVDRTRERQAREKDELRANQAKELEKAREDDFRKKEAETRQKEAEREAERKAKQQESVDSDENKAEYVPEYLEDGTLVLVKTYKASTPGQ